MHWLSNYTKAIANIAAAGDATELSYRTPMQIMLQAAPAEFGISVDILQEPRRVKNSGAPDFRISAKGGGVIGYVECKPPGATLQKPATTAQLDKYRALSNNILLTDCWRWRLLRGGKTIAELGLTESPDKSTKAAFAALLRTFMDAGVDKIGDANRLAAALAIRCARLRQGLEAHASDAPNKSLLHGLLAAFQSALGTELEFTQFADVFAQTLVYSLLLAKLKAPPAAQLKLKDISEHIPTNFAVIREIALFVQKLNESKYGDIHWVVGDILAIINTMNVAAVRKTMSYRHRDKGAGNEVIDDKGVGDTDDPYIYFYENFLAAYDARLRKQRGVYYTPPPVVKFIVRAVDDLLRRDFGFAGGLAEPGAVTALDFAAGTGTFMLEMIRRVLSSTPLARGDALTHDHLLKNFYGFELLMAPYAIAHLKLSQFLLDNGVPLKEDERINIFLTNTLEPISNQTRAPNILPALTEEAYQAQRVKDSEVLVICGNPPYAGHSQNKSEEQYVRPHKLKKNKEVIDTRRTWIGDLIEIYKYVDGQYFGERNPKWLQDDYVKFIRFAQWKMAQVECGIVAIITNHGFLDNPTFRGMRHSLLGTFDTLYFLDLHGNANKKETAPDGGKDENVFDIRQGVAISLLVKNPKTKNKGVFHADWWGMRKDKYAACLAHDLTTIRWKTLAPTSSKYLFIPRDEATAHEYEQFIPLQEIFPVNSVGIVTSRDHFAFAFDAKTIKMRIEELIDTGISTESLREFYNLKDTSGWELESARKSLRGSFSFDEKLKPCAYRPFDTRWCYYGKETMERHRPEVMRHILAGNNLAITVIRQASAIGGDEFNAVFVAESIVDLNLNRRGGALCCPLYRYDSELGTTRRSENLQPAFRRWIDDRYGTQYSPEDILGCIYAILHSPDYRKRYAEFLRSDFPRIPFPEGNAAFQRLAAIGGELIAAHLLRANCAGDNALHDGTGTSHAVETVHYNAVTERLYFNQHEWLAPVPLLLFNFQIGGYRPLEKYLKSRQGRTLTLAETETLKKAANAIAFTIKKMDEIDN